MWYLFLGVWGDVEHIAGIDNEIWYEYQGQIAIKIAKLPPEIWENGLCIIH